MYRGARRAQHEGTALHARQFAEHLFLHGGGAGEVVADRLHLLEAFGRFRGQVLALLHQLRQSRALVVHHRFFLLHGGREHQRLLERLLQRRYLGGDRHQARLHGRHAIQLLLHVDHLRAQRVAQALQALDFVAAAELFGELAIHVRGQHVEVVDAALELLDELQARADARIA